MWECEHGAGQHDGGVSSRATAPEGSRAWLLIEYDGVWAQQAVATPLPAPLAKLAVAADEQGIRVQLIRRPGRRAGTAADNATTDRIAADQASTYRATDAPRVFAAWTAGADPWLADVTAAIGALDLAALAAGERPTAPELSRMYLVCAHGRRDRCCARFGGPLARALAAGHPDYLWETTHVGGHKWAANLVLLPHGLYYGPCDLETATAAIGAYERGAVSARRYRGRAGLPTAAQERVHEALLAAGTMQVGDTAPETG